MTTRVNPAGLNRLLGEVEREVEAITFRVFQKTVDLCPKRTGDTAKTFEWEVTRVGDKFVGRVWSDDPVVGFIENGSRAVRRSSKPMGPLPAPYPRFIRSRKAIPPRPFMARALRLAQPYPVRER